MTARCGYLDQDEKQCKRKSVETKALFLESEMYSFIHDPDLPPSDCRDLATWVAVPLCKPHSEAFEGTEVRDGKLVKDKVVEEG